MKRKIFSKLLMVALVIAAVSSFVSCKDYDDDINNLRDQVNKAALQSNLEALQQKVDANASTAASAAAAALKAAQDAAAAATTADAALKSDLEKAIKTAADAVDAKATENGKKLADALNAIAALQSAVEKSATKEELAAAQESLNKAIEAAQKAAEEAAAKADGELKTALEKSISDVKAIADAAKALADKAATKDELTALNTSLTEKINALNTKLNDYYTKSQVDALIASKVAGLQNADQVLATIQSELSKYGLSKADETVASQISTAVTGLKNDLAAAMGVEEFSQISAKFDSFDTSVSVLYSAITSVEILDSFSGWGTGAQAYNANLVLFHGKITAADSKFGDNEAYWQSAEPQKEFKNGADINFEDGVIVRVNPGNATFTKDQILIVNSLGVALDDYIEIGDPQPFEGLLTRASQINSGLWYIPVKMKDGKTIDDIQLATYNNSYLDPVTGHVAKTIAGAVDGDQIFYAVAINNTKGEEEDPRYVVSSYDVTVDAEEYEPATTFSFNVNSTPVEEIRNRWEAATPLSVSEQCTTTATGADATNAKKELRWRRGGELSATAPAAVPATAVVGDPSKTAAQDATANAIYATRASMGGANVLNDYRSVKKPIGVQVGKKFTIKGLKAYTAAIANTYYTPTENTSAGTVVSDPNTKVQWYYVVLDAPRAIESAPSELNAWNSYDITGLNTVVSADKNLDITINSPEALGDIITFRVFAVNYDGTLADPDGRAFSVVVGEASVTNTVTVPYVATLAAANGTVTNNALVKDYTNNNSQIIEIPSDVTFSDKYGVVLTNYGMATVRATSYPTILKANIDIRWALFKDAAGTPATKWSEAKYIKIVVDNPQNMVDNATVQFKITGNASASYGSVNVNTLTVKVQKTLPTASTATIEWRNTLEPVNGVLTVYPLASANTLGTLPTLWPNKAARPATWNTANINRPYAVVDLAGYANNLSNTTNEWIVSDVKQNGTAAARTVTGTVPSNLGDGSAYSHFVLAMDKTMIHETVDAKINSKYVGVSLESVTATAKDVPFTSWTGKIKFADAIEDFMVLEANKYYYNSPVVNATVAAWGLAATDLRAKAEMAKYYYFYRGGTGVTANKLYGRDYAALTAPTSGTAAEKKAAYAALNLKDNGQWTELSNLNRGSDASWAGTFSSPYEIGELFAPTWGALVNPSAADLKRQVLCDYLGIIRIANLALASATGKITDYVLFDVANVQEQKGTDWVASTLITGSVAAGTNQITLTNIAGQNPTAHVNARIVISGKDVFNQVVKSDKLQMPFTIVANPAQNYMPFAATDK